MTDFLKKYPPRYAGGGAAPTPGTKPPMTGQPGGGMPDAGPDPTKGGMPGMPPGGGGSGAPGGPAGAPPMVAQGAGMDPAQAGGQQAGADVEQQLGGLISQYKQAPSQQLEHEITQIVVQGWGDDEAQTDPAAGGDASAMGGAMPGGATPPAATPPMGAGGPPPGMPPAGAGGPPQAFKRGGAIAKKASAAAATELMEMPDLGKQHRTIRKAKLS